MRGALFLLMSTVLLPVALAAEPAPAASFAQTVEATKKAMMGDPEHALASATRAVAIARRLPAGHDADVAVATAEWLHGEALLFMNRVADARPVVDATLARVETVAPNTKLHGDLLRSHGAIAASDGRVLVALNDYQRAHDVFRAAGEKRSQAMALQDIGQIYWDAGDYARVLDYYEQSAEVYADDPTLTLTMQNNRAEVFRKEKRFTDAAAAYRAALVAAVKLKSPLLQTRILTNLAGSEAEAGRLAAAQLAINRAARLAAHGEAAGWQPFVYGTAARIALDRGDPEAAQALIRRTFTGVDVAKTEVLFRAYHETAARIFEARGEERLALQHLKAFQRLDRETQQLTATAASQLLAARFDFANQNLKIANLKQGQLQRDIQLERQRGSFRTTLFSALAVAGGVVLALLLFGFFSLRRSRNRVRDANSTLSEVNGALEKALKAKTEFLATTSHEIRTPLNGILGMTQVLLADRRIETDVRDRIRVVHGAGETMRALVDDILDIAKMESGKLSVEQQPIELRSILSEVAQLWQGHATTKGLVLDVDLDEAPERIVSDGARIRQIVFNLMSNAVKFTEAGRIALEARVDAAAVGHDAIVISLSDTGVGIPADKQEEIFEAFAQVDGGVTRQFSGTGLGLAICRNLATALGGELSVTSAPGEGSTFMVRLPFVEPAALTDVVPGCGGLGDATVLLVEAELSVQGLMRMLLAAEASATEAVAHCGDALTMVQAGGIDHVIVNANTARSAAELRDLVSAARAARTRTTVLVSADGSPSVADVMLLGADQIIVKPIGGTELVTALAGLYGEDPETFVAPAFLANEAA